MRLPPAVPRVLFTLSRDYEEWGGPTRFLRPEGRAWATNDQARSDDDGDACRWASKQGNPTNPRNHAPPCAAGSRQTRPRVGDDVSALARLNIDFAGASFDNRAAISALLLQGVQ
jgi:hypothetical protein